MEDEVGEQQPFLTARQAFVDPATIHGRHQPAAKLNAISRGIR